MTNNHNKPNWLLLRGLARESGHWAGFIDKMQISFPEANIVTLDLPGTGEFFRQPSPCSITEICDNVRNQAQAKGLLSQPIKLLALSLGGMVAWEWLHKYPEDINSVALVNTSLASLSPFYQRLRWQSYGQFLTILAQKDLYQRELAIIRLVCNNRTEDHDRAQAWLAIQQQRPVSLNNCLRQILAAACYKNLDEPKQAVLLLNSRGDRLVTPACSLTIHNRWQIPIKTHASAGHDICLDDADWVCHQLKQWQASI